MCIKVGKSSINYVPVLKRIGALHGGKGVRRCDENKLFEKNVAREVYRNELCYEWRNFVTFRPTSSE
jgi:hypothetical protein